MIDLGFLGPRPVAVLGLGRSGMATARALTASGVPVWAWDDSEAVRAKATVAGVALVELARCDLAEVSCLVLSPGIPHGHPHSHPVVDRAREIGREVICDVELLGRAQKDATIVGITGTNGKSTTTALIGHILEQAGRRAAVGANIGVPALELPAFGADGVYVLELSSYQLELMPSVVPHVSVLLNVSADHQERHGGMGGYVAAKRRIFSGQGAGATAVIGVDDMESRSIFEVLEADSVVRRIQISGRTPVAGGVYAENGVLYDAIQGGAVPVLDMARVPALPGEHNGQNAAAAFAVAWALGIDRDTTVAAMVSFQGLAHRQELVSVIDGVAYVNDSKATNPEAAARALACYDAVYWIAGGRPKEGGLNAIAPMRDRIRHAFLIGEAAGAFASELAGKIPLTDCGTLAAAVVEARKCARANGARNPTVLLSPACASFDQFENFEARGETFRHLVKELEG